MKRHGLVSDGCSPRLSLLAAPIALLAASPPPRPPNSADVSVNGDKPWIDTGMDVKAGDKLHITAKGTVDFTDKPGVGPEGAQRGWTDTLRALSVASAGRGALVGQIGNDRAATPFLIGADAPSLSPTTGRLYLGVNQDQFSKPTAANSKCTLTARGQPAVAANPTNYDFKPLFASLDRSCRIG